MSRGAFSPATKRKVVDRQDGACFICSDLVVSTLDYSPLRPHEYHHRLPRRAGGRFGEMARVCASPANCLLLCSEHHRMVEAERASSVFYGYIVPEGHLPTTRAVYEPHSLSWWLLDTTGGQAHSTAPQPDDEVAA